MSNQLTSRNAVTRQDIVSVCLLQALAALLTLAPLLVWPLVDFVGHNDALFYAIILRLTGEHMAQGDLLPYWLQEANGGSGSPVALYYSMLSYQITALLSWPLAAFDPLGWKRLTLGMFVAQWIAGGCAWLWLRGRYSPKIALIVSLLFTLFPYKYIFIYLHGNLAQLWALALLPLLMMAADGMIVRRRGMTMLYAVFTALLLLTHPRTLLAFAAVPACYTLIFAGKDRLLVLGKLIVANLLSIMLSSYYWLPAALNLPLVHSELSKRMHFRYADNLSHEDLLFSLHYAAIALMVIGLIIHLPALRRSFAAEAAFWMVALLCVTLLSLQFSLPLWNALPPLQFLQFPASRFQTVAVIAGCVLSAVFLEYGRYAMPFSRLFYAPVTLYSIVVVMTVATLYHDYVRVYSKDMTEWRYVEKSHALNFINPSEYLTRWQPIQAITEANSQPEVERVSALPLAALTQGTGTATAHISDDGAIHVDALIRSQHATLRIRQLYWPNWSTSVPLTPDGDGLISLTLPQGEHHLILSHTPMPGERWGLLMSLVAWLGVLLWAIHLWMYGKIRNVE